MRLALGKRAECLADHLLLMKEGFLRRSGVCLSWHRWDEMESGRKALTVRVALRSRVVMMNVLWGKGQYYGQIEHQGWYRHKGMWRRDPSPLNPHAPAVVQVMGRKPEPDPYPPFELVAWRAK